MFSALKSLFTIIISMALVTVLFFVYVPENDGKEYSVLDEDTIELKMTVMSDCHIAGNEWSTTFKNFGTMLQDVKNCKTKNDVTIFLGDSTNTGQFMESILFYGAIRKVGLEGPFINVPGNHDTGNDNGNYDTLFQRFQMFNKVFLNLDVPAPYYYQVIDGYYFIVLSSEDDCCHEPVMTATQLDWFKNIMSVAGESGKPIFVLSHHHYTKYASTKSALYKEFQKYENVIYMYGHTHNGLSDRSVRTEGDTRKFTVVNVPCLRYNSKYEVGYDDSDVDDKKSNIGYQIEIYANQIVFRPRNFCKGVWSSNYQETVTISTAD